MDIKQLKFLCALDKPATSARPPLPRHPADPVHAPAQPGGRTRPGTGATQPALRRLHRGRRRVLAWARSLLAAQEGLAVRGSRRLPQATGRDPAPGCGAAGQLRPDAPGPAHGRAPPGVAFPALFPEFGTSTRRPGAQPVRSRRLLSGPSGPAAISRGIELAETRMGLLHHPSHFPLDAALLNWDALAGLPLGLLSAGMHPSNPSTTTSQPRSPIARLETDSVQQLPQAVQRGLCCAIMPLGGEVDDELRLVPHRGRPYPGSARPDHSQWTAALGAGRKPASRRPGPGWRRRRWTLSIRVSAQPIRRRSATGLGWLHT